MISNSVRVIVSVLIIPDCAPCGLTAAQLSCLHSWPGLGTRAGVLGTSTEISACLGPVCCRQAQGVPRDSSECWIWDRSLPGMRWCFGSGSARKHRSEPAAPTGYCRDETPREACQEGNVGSVPGSCTFPHPAAPGWAVSSTQPSGKAAPKACPRLCSHPAGAGRRGTLKPRRGLYQHSRHFRCV